jgi:hypothetical protein
MLIQDFVYIDAPFHAVAPRLAAGDVPMPSMAGRVTIGEAIQSGDTLVIPMAWQAEALSAAFPVLWADLEVAPFDEHETQLTLVGRYDPPLGAVGRQLDRLLLHRIVQASVRSFLEGLAAAAEAIPSSGSGGSSSAPCRRRPRRAERARAS